MYGFVYVSVNIRVWYVLCAYLGGIVFIIVYVCVCLGKVKIGC